MTSPVPHPGGGSCWRRSLLEAGIHKRPGSVSTPYPRKRGSLDRAPSTLGDSHTCRIYPVSAFALRPNPRGRRRVPRQSKPIPDARWRSIGRGTWSPQCRHESGEWGVDRVGRTFANGLAVVGSALKRNNSSIEDGAITARANLCTENRTHIQIEPD